MKPPHDSFLKDGGDGGGGNDGDGDDDRGDGGDDYDNRDNDGVMILLNCIHDGRDLISYHALNFELLKSFQNMVMLGLVDCCEMRA